MVKYMSFSGVLIIGPRFWGSDHCPFSSREKKMSEPPKPPWPSEEKYMVTPSWWIITWNSLPGELMGAPMRSALPQPSACLCETKMSQEDDFLSSVGRIETK